MFPFAANTMLVADKLPNLKICLKINVVNNSSNLFKAFTSNGPKAALQRSLVLERTRASEAVGPGFRLFAGAMLNLLRQPF
jgi:hypothetical protein